MDANAEHARADLEVLQRVLCGVDGSPAGIEAVRQSVRLRGPEGAIVLASVATPVAAAHAQAAVALEARAALALREAEREVALQSESHALVGDPVVSLVAAARDHGATLVAVGSHGASRLGGILAGSVATAMLRRAPCPVLIARAPSEPARFPARIAGRDRRLRAVSDRPACGR